MPLGSPAETQFWNTRPFDVEQNQAKKPVREQGERLRRNVSGRRKKIQKEDLINVLGRPNPPSMMPQDLLEDEIIPGKAVVLKMPERSMKTYFVPLPIDLEVDTSLVESTDGRG
jgi:hypothetical protein